MRCLVYFDLQHTLPPQSQTLFQYKVNSSFFIHYLYIYWLFIYVFILYFVITERKTTIYWATENCHFNIKSPALKKKKERERELALFTFFFDTCTHTHTHKLWIVKISSKNVTKTMSIIIWGSCLGNKNTYITHTLYEFIISV